MIPAMKDGVLKLDGKDNYGKPRQEYVDRVMAMTDEELAEETERKIWLSAFAANNPRSDYHWHVEVCYQTCEHRDPTHGMYQAAYDAASQR